MMRLEAVDLDSYTYFHTWLVSIQLRNELKKYVACLYLGIKNYTTLGLEKNCGLN